MNKYAKTILCDYAGEKKTLEENCQKHSKENNVEFSSKGTQQKNDVIEQGFDKIYLRMLAMMAYMGLQENTNTVPWPECASTTNKLKNIMVNPHIEKCARKKFYIIMQKYAKHFRTQGFQSYQFNSYRKKN